MVDRLNPAPLAYENETFINSPDGRILRILAEYQEPLARFRREQIQDTVVFFGSARFQGGEAAKKNFANIERNEAKLAAAEHEANLKTARAAIDMARYYEDARRLAYMLTEWSIQIPARRRRFVVTTGGGPGIMEAANRGAHDQGARSVGLNIVLPHEQYPNPYVTPDLCFLFHYFAIRKLHFVKRARALVVFPGGYGTLDELFEVLSLSQTRKIGPLPVILVGEAYWRRIFNPDALVDEGVIDPEDRDLFWFAETAEEAWKDILGWYEAIGQPLLHADTAGHAP